MTSGKSPKGRLNESQGGRSHIWWVRPGTLMGIYIPAVDGHTFKDDEREEPRGEGREDTGVGGCSENRNESVSRGVHRKQERKIESLI